MSICPDCPRKSLLPLVRSKSWCNEPTHDSAMKLCSRLRAYQTDKPPCPHFPETERIDQPWHMVKLMHTLKRKRKLEIEPNIEIDVNIDVTPRFSLRAYAAARHH